MDSIFTFKCFTLEQVKEINKTIKKNIFKKEESSQVAENVPKTGEFSLVPCLPIMKLVHPWLYQCQNINSQYFGYSIYWQFHLDTFNYNVYETKGGYEWHMDASKTGSCSDTKLTCLVNLSEEPYEGGEFKSLHQKKEVKFDSGMGLVIHSVVAHKVTPVTQGKRITLTYWATGPSWR
tara:strand:+ start:250 stop:783 length:534 start_codon:yes stop_codon:yes gene_type:complete